jgi:hypothetical protein
VWQAPRKERAEHAQRAADPERRLVSLDGVAPTGVPDDDGEDVSADESANLPGGGGDAVVLAPDSGGGGLGSHEPDIVAGSQLAARKEQPVQDHEGGDEFRRGECAVAAREDESDGGLAAETDHEGIARPHPVGDKASEKTARDVLRRVSVGNITNSGAWLTKRLTTTFHPKDAIKSLSLTT